MAQPNAQIIAGQALWTYRGITEENADHDFYVALDKAAAAEIANRFRNGSRLWVGREVELRVGAYTIRARLTNLEPLLATNGGPNTRFVAQYRERGKDEGQDTSTFIAEIIRYPADSYHALFESLVGIDDIKGDIQRKLILLLGANYIQNWTTEFYKQHPPEPLLRVLHERYPLIILEGEVGSGKTALARSIGAPVAQVLQTGVLLYIVNAQVRGGGHVGELTQNIARAFTEAERGHEREQLPVIILIDEADALAQTRGGSQTHHEDDAGVNTLIQRIDRLRGKRIAVLFATNLAQSLDAAIMRRAITAYHFDRPTAQQRAEIFRRLLVNTGVSENLIEQLVAATEPRPLPGFGAASHRFTFSDIAQRILPRAVEMAIYAQQPLRADHLLAACQSLTPTPEMTPRAR